MDKFLSIIKRPVVIAAIAIFMVIVISLFFFSKKNSSKQNFSVVTLYDLVQVVSATGRVKPSRSVDLAFEKGGKVAKAYVGVGDKVSINQILIVLENADLVAQLREAEAKIKAQQAKLDELKQGTRPEEIQVQEVKVESAKITLEDAKKNIVDKLQDAYTKSDDAVRNKVDQFFSNPRSQNPQLVFTPSDSQLDKDLEWNRLLIEDVLKSWKLSLDELSIYSDLDLYTKTVKQNLNKIKSFLDEAALAVNALTTNSSFSQTIIDGWRADVSTGRTNLNTAITNLTAADEKLKTAKSDLALAQQELALEKAGTVSEQITAQEAQLQQSEAQRDNFNAQIAKTILRAPISGVITKQDAKVGEIAAASTAVVSLMSESQFEIEANIPEADIAKIKIGDSADATLDTYGEDVVFKAIVTAIDPAETIIEGVATYKTTLKFIENDERIRSGMTANIDITGEKKNQVIAISQRLIISKNGDKIVKVLDNNKVKEVKVKTGFRGSDGNIEIVEGLKAGDKVVVLSD